MALCLQELQSCFYVRLSTESFMPFEVVNRPAGEYDAFWQNTTTMSATLLPVGKRLASSIGSSLVALLESRILCRDIPALPP